MWLSFPKFVHWAARCAALFIAVLFFTVVVGEIKAPHSRPPSGIAEWTGIALIFIVVIGMLAAWKWELYGALTSLGALTCWSMFARFNGFPVVVLWLAAPGLLFISDWAIHYGMPHDQSP